MSHLGVRHVQHATLDAARGIRAGAHVGHGGQCGIDQGGAFTDHLHETSRRQELGVTLR